jgi:hypothetical protein
MQNEAYTLAAILVPHFKLHWCKDNEDRDEEALERVRLAVERCYETHKTEFPSSSETDQDAEPSGKRRKISF